MTGIVAAISYPPIPIFDVGPLRLSLHGLFAALGFLAGAWLATRRLERVGGDTGAYQSVLTWSLIGALVGARYLTAPAALIDGAGLAALHPLHGNFSILGGFAGGIGVGLWRMRRLHMPVLPTLDASAFGLALGTIVGRIGDLAIVEHLGRATTVPWGYAIKPAYDVAPQHNSLQCTAAQAGSDGVCGVYHPVAAYDLLGAAVLLAVLVFLTARIRLRPGQTFAIWVAWYGLQRFVLDALRYGNGDATVGPLTWNQVSGLAAAIGGVTLLVWYRHGIVSTTAVAPSSSDPPPGREVTE